MFLKSTIGAVLIALAPATAFPALENRQDAAAAGCPYAQHQTQNDMPSFMQDKQLLKRAGTFDPQAQRIDVSGAHKFVPPNLAAGDQRGPCPGLNALANHNYLPHNGVATIPQFINATTKIFGMSLELAGFLAVYGTTITGNPVSVTPGFSIGGPSPSSTNILGNLLGLLSTPQGLSYSHNKYEGDSSPTRGDLYVYGDGYKVQVPQARRYIDNIVPDVSSAQQYDALFSFRQSRYNDSLYGNPYFFYPPFTGLFAHPAGYAFPKAMMANHSVKFPDGSLQIDNFKSFFALAGDGDSLSYQEGYERIPENWYRRAIGDEYSIPKYLADLAIHGARDPRFLSIGGNINGPNSFLGVDFGNLTGGVYNAKDLLKGNNLECFIYQAILAASPDLLSSLLVSVTDALQPLINQINTRLPGLGCPQLTKYDTRLFSKYPGYKRSNGAL